MVVCKESLLYGLQNRPTLLAKLIACRLDYCSCPLLGFFLPISSTSWLSSSLSFPHPHPPRASGYPIRVFSYFLPPTATTPCPYSQSDMSKSVPVFLKLGLYSGDVCVISLLPCSFQHWRCCLQYLLHWKESFSGFLPGIHILCSFRPSEYSLRSGLSYACLLISSVTIIGNILLAIKCINPLYVS